MTSTNPVTRISLLDQLKARQHTAALITTYNAFFPFYEQVIWRRLAAKGVRQHIVMMDEGMCCEALADRSTRPRHAGRRYALIPTEAPLVFHPKIVLLANKNYGEMYVGSHNLTMSGFSHNREITNTFDTRHGDEDKQALLRAWVFVKQWAKQNDRNRALSSAFSSFEELAPWLNDEVDSDATEGFFGAGLGATSLWTKVEPGLPSRAERVVVVGPYYDQRLAFLETLRSRFNPAELIVAFDPRNAAIPSDAPQRLTDVRFLDATGLAQWDGFQGGPLHAKLLWFEEGDGTEYLVTGSANPSAPAWIGDAKHRNAEAVVVRMAEPGDSFLVTTGLDKVFQCPAVDAGAWKDLGTRKDPTLPSASNKALVLAFECDGGFEIQVGEAESLTIEKVVLMDGEGEETQGLTGVEPVGNLLRLSIADEHSPTVRFIEIWLSGGVRIQAIAHHTRELLRTGASDHRQQFSAALVSLNSNAPNLEGLLGIAEKVIFGGDLRVKSESGGGGKAIAKGEDTGESAKPVPTTLAAEPREEQRRKARERAVLTGDIVLVLDALIYKLGQGLDQLGATDGGSDDIAENTRTMFKVSEEALVETEDEEDLQPSHKINILKTVEVCNAKLSHLANRLGRQLAKTHNSKNPDDAVKAIVQTAAVLGIFLRVRSLDVEADWKESWRRLVSLKTFSDLERAVVPWVIKGPRSLASRAADHVGEDGCEELSVVRGLVLWLMVECGRELKQTKEFMAREDLEPCLDDLLYLVGAVAQVSADPRAEHHLDIAMSESCKDGNEAFVSSLQQDLLAWGSRWHQLCEDPAAASITNRKPRPGDVGVILTAHPPVPRLITVVKDRKIVMKLMEDGDKKTTFPRDMVSTVDPAWFGWG